MKRYPTTHTRYGHRVTKHAQPNRAQEKGFGFTWVGEHGELDPLALLLTVEPITGQRALTADDLEEFVKVYGKLEPDDAFVHPASINIETLSPMTHEDAIADVRRALAEQQRASDERAEDVRRALENQWVESGTTEGGIRIATARDLQETSGDQVRIIATRDFKAYAIPKKRWMRKLSRRKRQQLLRRIWRRS